MRPYPPIGPPVFPATLAKSATVIGLTFSASAPSGRTAPSLNSTWSGLASHSLQARDVRRAGHERHGAVLVDRQRRARLAADVEPEAGGHAAALPLPERRVPVLGLLDRVERLLETDGPEFRAVGRLGPFT